MIRGLLIWLLASMPVAAVADPVTVQSGEHADFSRLVFLFGEVPDWQFGRADDGYVLRLARPDVRFDFSRVFEFIPRDRISRIDESAPGDVTFALDCTCHGDAFEIRNGLVIDIKDGPAPSSARFEARLTPTPTDTEQTDEDDGPMIALDALGGPIAGLRFAPARTRYAWQDTLSVGVPLSTDPSPKPADEAADHPATDTIALAQEDLVAQIARASAQGLVEARQPDGVAPSTVEESTTTETPISPSAEGPEKNADATVSDPVGIMVVDTAIDIGAENRSGGAGLTWDGNACLASDRLDVASWGPSPAQGATLSKFRSGLVGEFDIADAKSVEALVKAHVYLTFGAEANALLDAFDVELPNAELLRAMADIMDDGTARDPGVFAGQLGCETRAALWAVLARPSLGRADVVAQKAILGGFAELPIHLRRHLGPDIAQRFLAKGDTDTAAAIRSMIAQAPGTHGSGFQLLEADLAMSSGEHQVAEQQLSQIAAGDGPGAEEALIKLIGMKIDRRERISDKQIGSAMALAFEARGTLRGTELLRAGLHAMIHENRLFDAESGIDDALAANLLSPEGAAALRRALFEAAALEADDPTFLRLVLSGPLDLGSDPDDDEVRRSVAGRLVELGLPEQGRAVLSETRSVPTPNDRRLYAAAHLQEGRADLATGYLAGLSDQDSRMLMARAHEASGHHDQAARVYALLDNPDAMANALWRDGNWTGIRGTATGIRKLAAGLAAAPGSEVGSASEDLDDAVGPIARNRSLLETSRETRRVMADLLGEFSDL